MKLCIVLTWTNTPQSNVNVCCFVDLLFRFGFDFVACENIQSTACINTMQICLESHRHRVKWIESPMRVCRCVCDTDETVLAVAFSRLIDANQSIWNMIHICEGHWEFNCIDALLYALTAFAQHNKTQGWKRERERVRKSGGTAKGMPKWMLKFQGNVLSVLYVKPFVAENVQVLNSLLFRRIYCFMMAAVTVAAVAVAVWADVLNVGVVIVFSVKH